MGLRGLHREQLTQLAKVGSAARHVASSAATIALVAPRSDDAQMRDLIQFDLGQATMSVMLAAADLGIGSADAGVHDQRLARRLLGFPENRLCAFLITLGAPADRPLTPIERPDRRPFTTSSTAATGSGHTMVDGVLKCSCSASGSVSILGVSVGISKREVAAVLVGESSPLTRDRVVAQALKVIAQAGVGMLADHLRAFGADERGGHNRRADQQPKQLRVAATDKIQAEDDHDQCQPQPYRDVALQDRRGKPDRQVLARRRRVGA